MNTNIARTSITMDAARLGRLKLFAQRKKMTVSQVVELSVEKEMELSMKKSTKRNDAYKKLFELRGIGKSDPKLKNKSVDEILYGKKS